MPAAGSEDKHIPVALTIGGSDSSGGAGIQADLSTFQRFGVYGTSVVTALTAQSTTGISAIHPIPPEMVVEQYFQVMGDIEVDAVKTGMLLNVEIITALAEAFDDHPPPNLVVDPVMMSGTGVRLLDTPALESMIELIFPRAITVTPNLAEAAEITGSGPIDTPEAMADAAVEIQRLGSKTVLVKGGHLSGNYDAVDILCDGETLTEFRSPRSNLQHVHGTGCAYSAAVTAGLAKGSSLSASIPSAKSYITEAISDAVLLGGGARLLIYPHPEEED